MRHEHRYPICLHFYIGEGQTHIKQAQTRMHEDQPGWRRLKQVQTPSRAAGFTGMISICRMTLPMDVQDFHLAFLSRKISFSRVLNQVLEGLILIPQRRQTGLQELKLIIRPLWG